MDTVIRALVQPGLQAQQLEVCNTGAERHNGQAAAVLKQREQV